MSAFHRRGACPGLSAPMPTGDGLLVRLTPVEGIPLDAFEVLCAAAGQHGNGIIEITARGSIQVRGLTEQSAPSFAMAIADLELAADGVPFIVNPLDDEPGALIDARGVATTLRRAIATAGLVLGPKLSVIIDHGGDLHLDALGADVRLRAFGTPARPRIHIALGGDGASAVPFGSVAPRAAADVTMKLLHVLARHGKVRASDVLGSDGIAPFRDAVGDEVDAPAPLPPRRPAEPIGCHQLRHGLIALGISPAFGHADADTLAELTRVAAIHGARQIRAAPGRALLLTGLTQRTAHAVACAAKRLGLIVRPGDPRRRIAACAGAPACAAGFIPTRAVAEGLLRCLPELRGAVELHVSGCAKGCAHPAACALTVVGTSEGYGLIVGGTARAIPDRIVAPADLERELGNVAGAIFEAGHG